MAGIHKLYIDVHYLESGIGRGEVEHTFVKCGHARHNEYSNYFWCVHGGCAITPLR